MGLMKNCFYYFVSLHWAYSTYVLCCVTCNSAWLSKNNWSSHQLIKHFCPSLRWRWNRLIQTNQSTTLKGNGEQEVPLNGATWKILAAPLADNKAADRRLWVHQTHSAFSSKDMLEHFLASVPIFFAGRDFRVGVALSSGKAPVESCTWTDLLEPQTFPGMGH